MLTADHIRAAIVDRVYAAAESCNRSHIAEVLGTIRGLMWAILGKDPGAVSDAVGILKACGIPVVEEGREFQVPDEWSLAHGLDEDGRLVTTSV